MGQLRLIEPSEDYADQIMAYRTALLTAKEPFWGCGELDKADSYEQWIRELNRCDTDREPSLVYLALRKSDRKIVGMVEFFQFQSFRLQHTCGNLLCNILPEERGKGLGSELLEKMLERCWMVGCSNQLLVCDGSDPAAVGMIRHNGGKWLDQVEDVLGIGHSGMLQRYRLPVREIQEDLDDTYFDWFTQHWYRPGKDPDSYWD